MLWSQFEVPAKISVAELKVGEAFSGLTDREKMYAHFIGTASWEGAKVCLLLFLSIVVWSLINSIIGNVLKHKLYYA